MIRDHYLVAADAAVMLLADPAVAARWDQPSALAEFSVAGLAGHLARQSLHVSALVAADPPVDLPESAVRSVAVHYAEADWVTAGIDEEPNVFVRDGGERTAAVGAPALADQVAVAVRQQHIDLPAQPADRIVIVPWAGPMRLDDFLLTRLMEIAVHSDDLAISVDVPTPPLPAEAIRPVLDLLLGLATHRHGELAVLRALSRRERAPHWIAAF